MAIGLRPLVLPEGLTAEDAMHSAFGIYLMELLEQKRVTKMRLAEKVGVDPSYLTLVCRDPDQARRKGKRFQGPKVEYLQLWADELGLDDEQRATFYRLGVEAKMKADPQRAPHLERYLEVREEELAKDVARLKALVDRLTVVCAELARQLDQHGIRPKKSVAQELQALAQEINAADEDL